MLTDEFFLGTKLYHEKLTEICKPIAKYLGSNHVIYVNIDKHGKTFSICNNYKWVERFLEEKYYILDPLMVHPKNIHNGFSFDSASEDKEFKDMLLYDAIVKFDWCHSFAYIEKTTDGGYFGFDFGTTKANHQIINRLINESSLVKKMIRQAHKKIMTITPDLQEQKMDFLALKGDIFLSQRGLVFNEQYESQNKIQLLREMGFFGDSEGESFLTMGLSPQEINCLRIYFDTHSLKKVARDLNLATTTVTSYIENIKKKLKCNDKNTLLEKAEILASLGSI